MKKHLPLLFGMLCLSLGLSAQVSFSDDIESYATGAGIGVASSTWATWSGNVAAEDAKVSEEQAHSGTKSIKLLTTAAAGGPTDLLLPFGGQFNSGDFTLDMWMYVVSGKGGYFNFQSQTVTGKGWAADLFFDKNGTFDVNGNGNAVPLVIDGSYPVGEWFNLKMTIDLTNNKWEVFINGVSEGVFSNPLNQIASINFYANGPAGSLGNYYLDDVSIEYAPAVLPQKDASLFTINARTLGLAGQVIPVTGTIRNTGLDPITSFDAVIGNETVQITGINVPSLGLYSFTQSVPYTLVAGDQNIIMEILNVNGGVDGNIDNNTKVATAKGYVAAPGKAVVVEEATGTWCQWCPRGAVFMDRMADYYPNHFIGVAVHNNDPMAVPEYDGGLGAFPGFTGYPSVVVQREAIMDPSAMELPILDRLVLPPAVLVKNGAAFDASTGELTIQISGKFLESLDNGDDSYKFNAVITEDDMHGTTAAWNQKNQYAGGANGVMGGYEALPNPVPAAQMYYDHVGRAILGGFPGLDASLPINIANGAEHYANFSYQVEAGSNPDKMHIIGMILGPDGAVVNASKTTISEAVANGFITSGTKNLDEANVVSISPNPATESANISLILPKTVETSVRIFDQMGRLVTERFYGNLFGQQILPIQTGELTTGVYSVQILLGADVLTQKLVVNH